MSWKFARGIITRILPRKNPQPTFRYEPEKNVERSLAAVLESQVGVVEVPAGSNYGGKVTEYLKSAGISYPAPWCAAFVNWGCQQLGLPGYGAWVPSWYKPQLEIPRPRRDAWGLVYYERMQRYGHIFVVSRVCDNGMIQTIEGNTNMDGSREGTGVYQRFRNPEAHRFFAAR